VSIRYAITQEREAIIYHFNHSFIFLQLLLIQPGGPSNSHEEAKPIVDAAKRAGVKHIVFVSGANNDQADKKYVLGTRHLHTEQYIRENGIKLTALRPTSFYTNLLTHNAATIKWQNSIILPIKENQKMNFVSNEDIAAIASVVLTELGKLRSE
jgi:uncharacterized protein YbjT (DUF2867 family)